MPVDFAKLRDPVWRAEAAASRATDELARIVADRQRMAGCAAALAAIPDGETGLRTWDAGFIRSMRAQTDSYDVATGAMGGKLLHLSDAQQEHFDRILTASTGRPLDAYIAEIRDAERAAADQNAAADSASEARVPIDDATPLPLPGDD